MNRALLLTGAAVAAAATWLLLCGAPSDGDAPGKDPETRAPAERTAERPRLRRAAPPGLPTESPAEPDPGAADLPADSPIDAGRPTETRPIMVGMNRRKLAYTAFRAGDFQTAMDHALATLETIPNDGQAHRIAALSACALGDRELAQNHAEVLDRRRFERVQARCAERGIELLHPYAPTPVPDPVPME